MDLRLTVFFRIALTVASLCCLLISLDEAVTGDTAHLITPTLDPLLRERIARDLDPWRGTTFVLSELRRRVRSSGGLLMLWRLHGGSLTLLEGGGRDLQLEIGADRIVPFVCLMRRLLRRKRDWQPTYILLNVCDQPAANVDGPTASCAALLQRRTDHAFFRWSSPNGVESIHRKPSAASPRVPIFSFATIPNCYEDIIMPYGQLLHRGDDERMDAANIPWGIKEEHVCWRGRTNGLPHRPQLVATAAAFHSPALDVVAVDGDSAATGGGPWSSHVEQQKHCRVFVDVDGHTFSKRLEWQLRGTSTIVRGGIFEDALSRLILPVAAQGESERKSERGFAFDLLNVSDTRRALREAARAVAAPPESELHRRYAAAGVKSKDIGDRFARPGRVVWDVYWFFLLKEYHEAVRIIDDDTTNKDAEEEPAAVVTALELVPGFRFRFWEWPALICGYSLFVDVRGGGALPGPVLRLPSRRDGMYLAAAAGAGLALLKLVCCGTARRRKRTLHRNS